MSGEWMTVYEQIWCTLKKYMKCLGIMDLSGISGWSQKDKCFLDKFLLFSSRSALHKWGYLSISEDTFVTIVGSAIGMSRVRSTSKHLLIHLAMMNHCKYPKLHSNINSHKAVKPAQVPYKLSAISLHPNDTNPTFCNISVRQYTVP